MFRFRLQSEKIADISLKDLQVEYNHYPRVG